MSLSRVIRVGKSYPSHTKLRPSHAQVTDKSQLSHSKSRQVTPKSRPSNTKSHLRDSTLSWLGPDLAVTWLWLGCDLCGRVLAVFRRKSSVSWFLKRYRNLGCLNGSERFRTVQKHNITYNSLKKSFAGVIFYPLKIICQCCFSDVFWKLVKKWTIIWSDFVVTFGCDSPLWLTVQNRSEPFWTHVKSLYVKQGISSEPFWTVLNRSWDEGKLDEFRTVQNRSAL